MSFPSRGNGGGGGGLEPTDVPPIVRNTTLTGLAETDAAIEAADTVLTALGKAQGQIAQIPAKVRATTLTGLSINNSTAVTATDTLIVGTGKLQAQVNEVNQKITPTALHVGLTADATLGDGGLMRVDYDDIVIDDGISYSQGQILVDRYGPVLINAQIGTSDEVAGLTIAVFKNEVPIAQITNAAVTGAPFAESQITVVDHSDGTDTYEIYAVAHGATGGSYAVLAQPDITFLRAVYV